jgi:hypothetical protein
MLGLNLSSFSEIKQELIDFIDNNSDRYNIINSRESDVKVLIVDLLSGFLTFLNYKYMKYREESFIHSAKLETSIYNLARHFGYRINRPKGPELSIKYTGTSPLVIYEGFLFGLFKNKGIEYELRYFGSTRTLHYGMEVTVSIGILNEIKNSFEDYDFNGSIIINLKKKLVDTSIDNNKVTFRVLNEKQEISHDLEEYIVNKSVIDLTTVGNNAELWIYNKEFEYGFPVDKVSDFTVRFLEVPSDPIFDLHNIILETNKLELEDNFTYMSVLSNGLSGDSLTKIKEISPLFYTTFRRMVTEKDHQIVSRAYPGILDTYIEKDTSRCCSVNIYYLLEGSNYKVRKFSNFEKLQYKEYLNKFKMVSVSLNIYPVYVVNLFFSIKITYNANYKDITDNGGMETFIKAGTNDILNSYQIKLNKKFNISELIIKIGELKYKNSKVIEEVYFSEYIDEVLYEIPEEKSFSCNEKQYFNINRLIELSVR